MRRLARPVFFFFFSCLSTWTTQELRVRNESIKRLTTSAPKRYKTPGWIIFGLKSSHLRSLSSHFSSTSQRAVHFTCSEDKRWSLIIELSCLSENCAQSHTEWENEGFIFLLTSQQPAGHLQGAEFWDATRHEGGIILQRTASEHQHLILHQDSLQSLDMSLKENQVMVSRFLHRRRRFGKFRCWVTLIWPTVSSPVTSRVWVFWARRKSCIFTLRRQTTTLRSWYKQIVWNRGQFDNWAFHSSQYY